MKSDVVILIPIYKSQPSWNEMVSFAQCIKVLGKRLVSICTYDGLDIQYYTDKLDAAKVKYTVNYFDKKYFRSTAGYNELHLSADFYKHYSRYEHMLVYQLDAYIFEDRLDEWIAKGYDYVGAPWLNEDGTRFTGVGNGGFCLKKISWWYNELLWQLPVWSPAKILKRYPIVDFTTLRKFIVRMFGYGNNVKDLFARKYELCNEDCLPKYIQSNSWRHKPKLPSEKEAMQFSFERFPSKLLGLNSNRLPMGCHAWEKYEYEEFWKQYIV